MTVLQYDSVTVQRFYIQWVKALVSWVRQRKQLHIISKLRLIDFNGMSTPWVILCRILLLVKKMFNADKV